MSKRLAFTAGLLMLGACAKPAPQTVAAVAAVEPLSCPFLEANAQFSCWWSENDAPLSHCVLVRDNNPGCGLPAKAMAYFNRGAIINRGVDHGSPNGGWIMPRIYEDAEGRVGRRAHHEDGTVGLSHHTQSDLGVMSAPKPPVWPRWPAGYEGGPEQVRR